MIEILVAYMLYEGEADVVWWLLYAVVLFGRFYFVMQQQREKRRELHGV
jgi:preprotein translocase subunit YajC